MCAQHEQNAKFCFMFSEHKPANLLLISFLVEESLLFIKRLKSIMISHRAFNSQSAARYQRNSQLHGIMFSSSLNEWEIQRGGNVVFA